MLARYEHPLLRLQDALSKGITAGDSDATEAIRELAETETVKIFRDPVLDELESAAVASNQDLRAALEQGTFREDLYYRLNVILIKAPPLRDREGDVEGACLPESAVSRRVEPQHDLSERDDFFHTSPPD